MEHLARCCHNTPTATFASQNTARQKSTRNTSTYPVVQDRYYRLHLALTESLARPVSSFLSLFQHVSSVLAPSVQHRQHSRNYWYLHATEIWL